jgi:hypothetical protein
MRRLVNADYLILFGNNNRIQVPGKLYNYMGSGIPILYVSNGVDSSLDPCVLAMDHYGVKYRYIDNTPAAIEEALISLAYADRDLPKREHSLPACSWGERARRLSDLLSSVISARKQSAAR